MKEYYTTKLPKGTLLFRSVYSTSDIVKDFAGIPVQGTTTRFCIYPNFNVFFYPFPFVSESISNYTYTNIFILNNDVNLINLIMPSEYSRDDRIHGRGGVIACNDTRTYSCSTSGFKYDPCIDFKKVKEPDIVGMIAIAKEDSRLFLSHLTSKYSKINSNHTNYYKLYNDARGVLGVPEIILHPHRIIKKNTSDINEIHDYTKFMLDNIDTFNYSLFHTCKTSVELETILKQLLNEGFLKANILYKATTNIDSGFYQLIDTVIHPSPKFNYHTMDVFDELLLDIYMSTIESWVANGDDTELLALNNLNSITTRGLPENVKKVSLRDNKIGNIEDLPPQLEYLDLGVNTIIKIENLPSSITQLHLEDNSIRIIDNLPLHLLVLYIHNNKVTTIKTLPPNLQELYINNNPITYLEELPDTIEVLILHGCSITHIERFPANLKTLDISFNPLNNIPELPKTLTVLAIDASQKFITKGISNDITITIISAAAAL
jgi:hypothetical protein